MPEELIIRHCAPTLAGIKTANMFHCPYGCSEEMRKDIRWMNRALMPKGLRVLPLRYSNGSALLYFYRPSRLQRDLSDGCACKILQRCGYEWNNTGKCVARLACRIRECEQFPHEVGLFLGYPSADVRGFIENQAKGCKCCGCWKVYENETEAKRIFVRYKKCTDAYMKQWKKGKSVEHLTVSE
ncbi:MAG: DUF3793 family protein [Christensenella sp.]|nr:DUF3793 family protein [Christensenella sp.]